MRPTPPRPRRQDWPERLASVIEQRRHTPFRWGTQDCCSFAADAVLAMTGHDWLAPHRGAYFDAKSAEAIIGADGLEALVAGLMEAFGAQECPAGFVQRGDVALVLLGNELTVGVVLDQVVAAPGLRRLDFVPGSTIQRAWGV